MTFFPQLLNGLKVTHSSPQDFSVAYTSNVTITVSSSSFIVDDDNCTVVVILYKPSGGDWQSPLYNGINGVSLKASAGVITVANAGTPFAAGDTLLVGIDYQDKSFTAPLNATQNTNLTPDSKKFVAESLVDTTDESAATHYYPSATGASMDDYSDLSLTGKLIDADGTLTLSVEMMNDEDLASGDFIQVYGYDDKNNATVNQITVTNGTLTYALSYNKANYSRWRVKVIASGATNTVIVKPRRKY